MSILSNLLAELDQDSVSGIDEAVKKICDAIYDEEYKKFSYPLRMPKGANIFLAIECQGRDDMEVGFLTLERDSPGVFFVGYWVGNKNSGQQPTTKRVKTWEIKENKPEKIILEYAKILKYLVKEQ